MATISGGDKLEAKLKELATKLSKGAALKVGFLEGATYPDGTSVATIAALQNFGGGSIPPRPFFTNMVEEKGPEWGEKLARLLAQHNYDVPKALESMGMGIAGQLRQSIVDTNDPPNSPVTALLKQRFPRGDQTPDDVWQAFHDAANGEAEGLTSKPLVWSGHMLASVDYEVTE